MRVVGWIASLVGVAGVIVSNGLIPVVWMLRLQLVARFRDLLAIPDGGLGIAITLADTVTDRIAELSTQIGLVRAAAERLADAPGVDTPDTTAASDLAATIAVFIAGPYAQLRDTYARLRERASTLGDALASLSDAIPIISLPDAAVERLEAIDARMAEIDVAVTELAAADARELAQPGVATRIGERAAAAQASLATVNEHVAAITDRMEAARDRLVDHDHRVTRLLTVGALTGSAVALLNAGLHVLLYQQGRRWSRSDRSPGR